MSDSAEPKPPSPGLDQRRRLLRLSRVIAIVASSVLFACAGCSFLTSFLTRSEISPGPEGAAQIAANITDWTLPPGFSGKYGSTNDVRFWRIEIANFQNQKGRGFLVIGQLRSNVWLSPDSLALARVMIDRETPELRKINLRETETRILTVRGLPATFEIGHGEDRASITKYCQVVGHFRGKADDAVLILQCEEGVLSNEEIDAFLKSIK